MAGSAEVSLRNGSASSHKLLSHTSQVQVRLAANVAHVRLAQEPRTINAGGPMNPPRILRHNHSKVLWVSVLVAGGALAVWAGQAARQGPPETRRDNVKEVIHGVELVDPYRWLEDGKSPETQAWIEAQNAYTRSLLESLPGRERLKRRITELQRIDETWSSRERNGRYFFEKRLASQEQFVIYMRQGLKGDDQVLIDPHPMSPDRTSYVSLMAASKDGTLIAYALWQRGENEATLHVFNVDTRRDLPDLLPRGVYFSVSFKPDNSGFYYTRQETRGSRVYYHPLGSDPPKDTELFGKGYGSDKIMFADLSEDGRYLLIHVWHGMAANETEIYFQDVVGRGPIQSVVNDLPARFFGAVGGNQLFMRTNWKAANGRVFAVDLNNPVRDRWREIIPETDGFIEEVAPVGGKLVVNYTRNLTSQVRVFDPSGRHLRDITLPAIGSIAVPLSGRWESSEAFYAFSSYTVPKTIYRYDMATGNQEVWARLEVPVDSDRLEVKQVWYESKDKTRIPMFLVYAKGMQLDGSRPTLLSGYGGFAVNFTPWFTPAAVLWAERGGVYAWATLRGGAEFGEEWHKAGMLDKKQNVFDDFIAAAEWLIQNRYTNATKLAIEGISNGGLLMGAALTQRPDLFGAVACRYPLLDMVRYHKFLLAPVWLSEYGSADDPEQFKYLYAYSPYHHVKPGGKYPAVLFFTGDSDPHDSLHSRKMAALLQSATNSGRPVLFRYETVGAFPLSTEIEEMTDEHLFLFWQLGTEYRGEKQ
jgi:prolyl oligopeptidase